MRLYIFKTFFVDIFKKKSNMNFCKQVKGFLLQADLFYSSEILKYNSETQYKTLSGAIVSLILMGAIISGFSSMIISTMERTSITSSLEVKKSQDPELLKLKDADNNFMFGIVIVNMYGSTFFNISSGPQIFDVKMLLLEGKNSVVTNMTFVPLQQCTKQHWKKYPSIANKFDTMNRGQSLCPPLKSEIDLVGYRASPLYKNAIIQVSSCVNSSFNGNKCAPQSVIDAAFATHTNFYMNLLFSNPVINPNEPNHISYYLEERNHMIFSKNAGAQMQVEFLDYKINTDVGILPYQNIQTDEGYIVQDRSIQYPYVVTPGLSLGQIYLVKSPNQLIYTRQVLKISTVIKLVRILYICGRFQGNGPSINL